MNSAEHRYQCHNRKPFLDEVRLTNPCLCCPPKFVENKMSRDCRYDLRATDPSCAGCSWIDSTTKEQK